MPSLKEIRARINSVASTEKITNAMKMVSAAKLKKSEGLTLNFMPYRNKLSETLSNYLGSLEETVAIPLANQREVRHVTLIAFASSNGLCGVYNANIIKLFKKTYDDYVQQLGKENVDVILFGKKVIEYAERSGISVAQAHESLSNHLSFDLAVELSNVLMKRFIDRQTDRVVAIYNHHKNAGVQYPMMETLLPIAASRRDALPVPFNYIVEPSKEEFINALVPKVIHTIFYAAMLDAMTAEHGARMTAMLIASDNAATLLQELRRDYNRARQNVITSELIDIVGGAEALQS